MDADQEVRLFAIQHFNPQTGVHLDADRAPSARTDYLIMHVREHIDPECRTCQEAGLKLWKPTPDPHLRRARVLKRMGLL